MKIIYWIIHDTNWKNFALVFFSLHLKEEARDYLEPDTIRQLVKKYSQFINFPIYLWTSKVETVEEPIEEPAKDEKKDEAAEDKKEDEKKDDEKKDDEKKDDEEKKDKDEEKKDKDDDVEVEEEKDEDKDKKKTKTVRTFYINLNLNFIVILIIQLLTRKFSLSFDNLFFWYVSMIKLMKLLLLHAFNHNIIVC